MWTWKLKIKKGSKRKKNDEYVSNMQINKSVTEEKVNMCVNMEINQCPIEEKNEYVWTSQLPINEDLSVMSMYQILVHKSYENHGWSNAMLGMVYHYYWSNECLITNKTYLVNQ